MGEHRVFADRAELYDFIYHEKPYATEVSALVRLLIAHGVAPGERVLEAACGTGRNLRYLSDSYDVSGFDLSEQMLAIARRNVPQVPVFHANLESFEVTQPVAAVLCLFSSIGYLHTRSALERMAHRCHVALRSGGLVAIEPFLSSDRFQPGVPHLTTCQDEEVTVVRAVVPEARDHLAVFRFSWLVARPGVHEVEHFVEQHELRFGEADELSQVFESAGFEVQFLSDGVAPGRRLLLGRKV